MIVMLMAVLILGFVLDGYAVFLRVTQVEGLAEILAMANLVQYMARISNIIVIFILSYAFETQRLSVNVALLFFISSVFGMLFVFILIRSKSFCNLITFVLRPVLYFSFKNISGKYIWRDIGFLKLKSIKLAMVSATTNLLIVIAMFVPFGIASHYPEMRMTSVYAGQMMNFFATLLVFSIQDPISMRRVDGGAHEEVGSALLYGRVISYFLASIFFIAMWAL